MLEDIPNIGKIGDLIALASDVDFDTTSQALHKFTELAGPEKDLIAQLEIVCRLGKQLKMASEGTLQSLIALLMTSQMNKSDP